MRGVLSWIFAALLGGLVGAWLVSQYYIPQFQEARVPKETHVVKPVDWSANSTTPPYRSAIPSNFMEASSRSVEAVVAIQATQLIDVNFWSGERYTESTGSGVIISSDGYIATNNHVVEDAKQIIVLLNDQRSMEAELIGTDPNTDLALLKINASQLPYLEFGDSDSLSLGEWVLAVGNPFRLQSTVTAGIVSAKGRNINISTGNYGIESFIQTDAAVNPGNSGGALVNTKGDLIGINTAIITQSGRYEGYSFAVPSNLARKVMTDLKEYGVVHRGLLGVNIANVNADIAKEKGLPGVYGAYVSSVLPNSAADDAGLDEGDVIVELNGIQTTTSSLLQEQLARYRPGDEVELTFYRNGEISTVKTILKNQLNTTELIATRRDPELLEVGFELRDLSASEKKRFKRSGVKVVSIYRGSLIDQSNMIPDYIITKINRKPVDSVDEFIKIYDNSEGKILLEGFYEKYKGDYPYAFIKPK